MPLFHLIRHASHTLLGRVLVGRGPIDISAQGQAEARAIAQLLAGEKIAAIYASPQPRALQTAAPIAAFTGLAVAVENGIDEIDMGGWTGAAFDDLRGDPRWETFNTFRGMAQIPGGETMPHVQARAVGALLRLAAVHAQGTVVLVSHSDVIKAILAHCLGMPLDFMGRLDIAPASVSSVELGERYVTVRCMNVRAAACA